MQGDHNAADVAEAVGREILVGSGAFPCQELMPASRGPPFREEVGSKSDFISDLFIDDADVISLAHPSVCTPGAARVAAAEAALTRAGIIVHEDKGHDDATDEAVWGAGFCSHIVSDERTRLRGLVDLTWVAAFCRAVAPKVIETLIGYWSHAPGLRLCPHRVNATCGAPSGRSQRAPRSCVLSAVDRYEFAGTSFRHGRRYRRRHG